MVFKAKAFAGAPLSYAYADTNDTITLSNLDLLSSGPGLQELAALNAAVSGTGEVFEGNVCYDHELSADQFKAEPPSSRSDLIHKRANLATLARNHTTMLEIGLNAGHSALICLLANPTLNFFAVDIMMHRYTEAAAAHLKARFGRRFEVWRGDSREVMPRAALTYPKLNFDLLHVDGGHSTEIALADLSNSIRMASSGASLIFDDVNASWLGETLETVCRLGYLAPLKDHTGLYPVVSHQVLRVV